MKQLLFIFTVVAIGFSSCQKGATGPKGDPGPDAKTFNFSLTFTPGSTFQEYSGVTGFDDGDMIITYIKHEVYEAAYYVQIPYTVGNLYFYPEISEATGNIYINVEKTDNTAGQIFTTNTTIDFKAILIKSSYLKDNPNVDFANFKEVEATLNL